MTNHTYELSGASNTRHSTNPVHNSVRVAIYAQVELRTPAIGAPVAVVTVPIRAAGMTTPAADVAAIAAYYQRRMINT